MSLLLAFFYLCYELENDFYVSITERIETIQWRSMFPQFLSSSVSKKFDSSFMK